MAARASQNASEVRESIEAKGSEDDDDVEMDDAAPQPTAQIVAAADQDADGDEDMEDGGDGDGDGDADADGELDDEPSSRPDQESKSMLSLIESTLHYLCNVEEDGEELAAGFQRIPNKRILPDYFDVIKDPIAFSTIRGKILKKQYNSISEFIRDVSLICHNAQVYNRPSAPIFQQAVRLREVFKEKLMALAKAGSITAEESELPDLGELPEMDDSPPPDPEEDEVDDEDDEEDEEDDDDDSDDDGVRRRRTRRIRLSSGRKEKGEDGKEDDSQKKRGRPPKVFTPMEARIHAVLKGLRKPKNDANELRIVPFEKLPDKTTTPEYYQAIKNPMALDLIKKKAKRKKYQNVDQVLADVELMFENAKAYNEEGSEVYADAVELQKQARVLAAQEKAKPDDDFRDEDGKLPLAEIVYNGDTWKVGDWVHIRNPNDLEKPIVAQLYRTWKDSSGQEWVNACWYYRPEQTVHRHDKFFFENEVVKTGQYRDHRIEEVVDRCFVMFITRYNKGRPRGLKPDKSVYVCEARYNEEKFRFNKIKTWASCVPDEVREKDYEMDLYDVPHKLKKVPSPIKHLLQEDSKETDALPKPTWGSPNAPPMIGAVHRRPREANESPPPEPTPPPPAPAAPADATIDPSRPRPIKVDSSMAGTAGAYHPGGPAPSPSPSLPTYGQHFAPPRPVPTPTPPSAHHMPAVASHPMPSPGHIPQSPHYPPHAYGTQQFSVAPSAAGHHQMSNSLTPAHDLHRMAPTPAPAAAMTPVRPPMAPTPNTAAMPHSGSNTNVYNPPRAVEVYTLPKPVNDAIPPEVRDRFHRDSDGNVLFFTAPSVKRPKNGVAADYSGLGHSTRYLHGLESFREERRRKRKERDDEQAEAAQKKADSDAKGKGNADTTFLDLTQVALRQFVNSVEEGNAILNESLGGWDLKALKEAEKRENQTGDATKQDSDNAISLS